ncbi:hypothetical protein BDZ91DRAFT_130397 [Kalaharituber pfeilii]|nr:hypothetical protein BDZ91DRAFT_130397 [Kalaharituber pfeilii]
MLVVNAPGIVSIYSHATSRSSHDRDYELHGQSNSNGHRSATAPPSSIINGKYDGLTLTTCTRACDEQVDATVKIKQPQDYTGPGDSRECIVVDQPDHAAEKNMVIHQSVTYSVKTEYKTTPQAGVLGRTAHVNSDKAIYEDDGTSRQSSSRLSMDGADSSQGPPVSKTDSMHFEP